MKIIISSKDRFDNLPVLDLIKGHDFLFFVHNQEQYDEYIKHPDLNKDNLINVNIPYGMGLIRKWILENYIGDEWFLILDDNIENIYRLSEPHYSEPRLPNELLNELKPEFETEISFDEFLKSVEKDIVVAERTGAKLIGYAVVDNPYFRGKKYRQVGYVIGKTQVIKKTDITFDETLAMDDYGFTAENLKRFGKVLINNYIYTYKKHYAPGGIGTYEERLKAKIRDCDYLMKKYPNLFRYKKKVGCNPKAELQLKYTNTKQIHKWRKQLI